MNQLNTLTTNNRTNAVATGLAFPIFIYEMTVAGWLLKKGFNLSRIKTTTPESGH